VDPRVAEFLRFEREWRSGDRTGRKVLLTGLVPLSLEKDPVLPTPRKLWAVPWTGPGGWSC
jgi:hypothetical protein